jgi:hypothetical protein
MQLHPDQVAARLGLDEITIARLRARGQLERLALTEPEIRERLYRAHLAYLHARGRCTEGSGRAKVVGSRGLLVCFVASQNASAFAAPAFLTLNPTKAGRPWIAAGESHDK